MYSARGTRALPRVSFLIRRSWGQRSVSTSPRLIAAAHVLLRLLAPRHPPCALILLIGKNTLTSCYGVFKVRADAEARPTRDAGPHLPRGQNSTGLSKLNSETFSSRST